MGPVQYQGIDGALFSQHDASTDPKGGPYANGTNIFDDS